MKIITYIISASMFIFACTAVPDADLISLKTGIETELSANETNTHFDEEYEEETDYNQLNTNAHKTMQSLEDYYKYLEIMSNNSYSLTFKKFAVLTIKTISEIKKDNRINPSKYIIQNIKTRIKTYLPNITSINLQDPFTLDTDGNFKSQVHFQEISGDSVLSKTLNLWLIESVVYADSKPHKIWEIFVV